MRPETRDRILELSRNFYSQFAGEFSNTRQRIQPGVQRILNDTPLEASILDLGCGNGSVARGLTELAHQGQYLGVDSSAELIRIASSENRHPHASFLCADLSGDDWHAGLQPSFDRIFSFATIHHVPGHEERVRILQQAASLLKPGALMLISTWNFLASPRYRQRILPWESTGLGEEDVEPDDYLLDWRRGGTGVRYVHFFSADELALLGQQAGFMVENSFLSDGQNGILGLYQVWKKAPCFDSHPPAW